MDCGRKTDACKAKLVQTSRCLFNGEIDIGEWKPSPCLKPARVSRHQFGIAIVDAPRSNFRLYGIGQLGIPPDGGQDLAIDFGFIKLTEAFAEFRWLRYLRVHGGVTQAHKELYVLVWIVVGMNINTHSYALFAGAIPKDQPAFPVSAWLGTGLGRCCSSVAIICRRIRRLSTAAPSTVNSSGFIDQKSRSFILR